MGTARCTRAPTPPSPTSNTGAASSSRVATHSSPLLLGYVCQTAHHAVSVVDKSGHNHHLSCLSTLLATVCCCGIPMVQGSFLLSVFLAVYFSGPAALPDYLRESCERLAVLVREQLSRAVLSVYVRSCFSCYSKVAFSCQCISHRFACTEQKLHTCCGQAVDNTVQVKQNN